VLLALSTGHAVGLALVAGAFVAFAFLSALVIPRRWPQYPGRHLGWFIVATLVFFVAMLGAVQVFAAEPEEETATTETGPERPGMTTSTTQPPAPPAAPKGDAAAGKTVFAAQGCASCHTFAAASATGKVGPDLDTALKGKDAAFIHESIVDPNKEIASGFQPNIMPQNFGQTLTPKQVDDLVAFLQQGS
jgi:mono/diheme cytochrome c family protein